MLWEHFFPFLQNKWDKLIWSFIAKQMRNGLPCKWASLLLVMSRPHCACVQCWTQGVLPGRVHSPGDCCTRVTSSSHQASVSSIWRWPCGMTGIKASLISQKIPWLPNHPLLPTRGPVLPKFCHLSDCQPCLSIMGLREGVNSPTLKTLSSVSTAELWLAAIAACHVGRQI